MRAVLAVGLLITLGASANAAPVHRFQPREGHLRPVQRVTAPCFAVHPSVPARGLDELGKTKGSMSVGPIESSANACSNSRMPWAARFVKIWTQPRAKWAEVRFGLIDNALFTIASAAANRAGPSSVVKLAPTADNICQANHCFDVAGVEL